MPVYVVACVRACVPVCVDSLIPVAASLLALPPPFGLLCFLFCLVSPPFVFSAAW